jgi:hypothetical protein
MISKALGGLVMETVKVDIQKLQQLNDRINQTIDALTQLRQSVHAYQPMGLQHTQSFIPQQQGFIPQQQGFIPQQQGLAYNVPQPYGQPFGLQHTAAPFIVPQQSTLTQGQQSWPYSVAPWSTSAQMGWVNPMGGLSHSTVQQPIDASLLRLTQTFPYAFSPVPVAVQ